MRCTIPYDVAGGIQYLLYNADNTNRLTETDETNNLKYLKVYVVGVPGPYNDSIPDLFPGQPGGAFTEAGNMPAAGKFTIYPNPAKDMLSLSFRLPESGYAELVIFDNMGKQVGGFGKMYFEASDQVLGYKLDLAPGVYTLQLITGGKAETVMLLKE